MKHAFIKIVSLLAVMLTLSACDMFMTEKPNDPRFAAMTPEEPYVEAPNNGSIYNAETALVLFETIRARHIGDILTVTLDEKTDAQKKATTSNKKDYTAESKNPTLYGALTQFDVPKFLPLATNKDNTLEFKLEGNRKFDGEGESKQNNKLTGSISVTVYQVLHNGNLKIRGEKWMNLNQGKEFIRLSGVVRPSDIRSDNTVSSKRIADARISYSGTGDVSDSNVMGWLAKFFGSIYWIL